MEETSQQQLGLRIWALLLKPPHSASVVAVQHDFQVRNGYPCAVEQMEKYRSIIEVSYTIIHICVEVIYIWCACLAQVYQYRNGSELNTTVRVGRSLISLVI